MANFIMYLVLWPSHWTEFAIGTVEQNTDQNTGDIATCCPFPLEDRESFSYTLVLDPCLHLLLRM